MTEKITVDELTNQIAALALEKMLLAIRAELPPRSQRTTVRTAITLDSLIEGAIRRLRDTSDNDGDKP